MAPAAAARIETEYKLAVPAGEEAALWRWLNAQYRTEKPKQLGPGWQTATGEEQFDDRYFDNKAQVLLRARASLRHRRRFEAGTLKKQLVQLKSTDDAAGLMRQELKFKPTDKASAATPLAELLRPDDRPRLDSALAPFKVTVAELTPALTLHQRRRRLYFRFEGADFATLTLDSSYHLEKPLVSFTELELELNEKRYTGASGAERAQMQVVLDGFRADVFRRFPRLKQDQLPKYNKLVALVAAHRLPPPAEPLPHKQKRGLALPSSGHGPHFPALPPALFSSLALAVLGGWAFAKARAARLR